MGNEHYKNLSLASVVGEVWKDVSGFEDYYQVSNMGRVKSLERPMINWTGGRYKKKEQILKQRLSNTDRGVKSHLATRLQVKEIALNKQCQVSNLVANAFLTKKNDCKYVFHKDFNPYNNCMDNLYYGDLDDLSNIVTKCKKNKTSKFRGISICRETKTILMGIVINGKQITKSFETELEAAKEYDRLVKKYNLNRELNFPDEK